jgi:hypothetical protein
MQLRSRSNQNLKTTPSMIASNLPKVILEDKRCRNCSGQEFYFWWESSRRRIYQCADKDCGIFVEIEKAREVFEL